MKLGMTCGQPALAAALASSSKVKAGPAKAHLKAGLAPCENPRWIIAVRARPERALGKTQRLHGAS